MIVRQPRCSVATCEVTELGSGVLIFFLFLRQTFPGGEKVTYTGKEVLCAKCSHIPVEEDSESRLRASPTSFNGTLAGTLPATKHPHCAVAIPILRIYATPILSRVY